VDQAIAKGGKSHLAYMDAAHWSTIQCALQDTYTEVAWTHEGTLTAFLKYASVITVRVMSD